MAVIFALPVLAKELLPIESAQYTNVGIPSPPTETGQKIATDLLLSGLGYVKVLAVVIGILFITLQGYRLVMAGGDEEELTKVKKSIVYIIIAFVLLSMSQDIAKIFDMSKGTIIGTPSNILKTVHLFDRQVEILMTFVKYIVGAIATTIIVLSGLQMVTGGSDEEEVKTQKSRIFYSLFGLIVLTIGDIAINKVFYNVDKEVYSGVTGVKPSINVTEGVQQLIGITNYVVTFFGVMAVLMLIIAAIFYATSAGNEDQMSQAKRIIIATVIAMIIMFGAFALVSTIVAGQASVTLPTI